MPILTPTDIHVTIRYLGVVRDRARTLCSEPIAEAELTFDGMTGDCHAGLTRASCVRVRDQYPQGTQIRNTRQLSILSVEEMNATAAAMGMADLPAEWVGANMVVEGARDFTTIPPASRLIAETGASIVVDMENAPCQFPAREIEARRPGFGAAYKSAATGRRGVTCWVEREGTLTLGARLRLHAPPQRLYAPAMGS